MGVKEEIYSYCLKENRKLTAMEIVNALFPGKPQPYVNAAINKLVSERRLVREDSHPYTVRVPAIGEDIGQPIDYSRGANGNKRTSRLNAKYVPRPSNKEVDKYLSQWEHLENYVLQERALNKLFLETYKSNTEIDDVLIKVAALNDFYSTNIFSIYPVAKRIVEQDIDKKLKAGDLQLVNDIAKVTSADGKEHNFYSFATKYCSHHQPDKYAIFDSYVEKMLNHFRRVDGFSDYKDSDLKEYTCFFEVLTDFKKYYSLEEYSLKELDRYLWLLGKEHFPKKY